MPALTAIDAISPAWHHTRRLLLDRRDWRVLLKITVVAILSQFGGCNAGLQAPNMFAGPLHLQRTEMTALVLFIFVAAVVGIGVWLAFFYLTSRLELTLFDIVLRSDTTVGPAWSRYGAVSWRWVGAKIAVLFAAMLCAAPVFVPALFHLIHFVQIKPADGQIRSDGLPAFLLTFALFILGFLTLILFMSVASSLLHDFGLPSLALEGTTLRQTLSRIIRLIRAEPLQIFLYLVMRFLLALAGGLCAEVSLVIGVLIAAIPLGGLGALLYFSLHSGGFAAKALMVLGWIVLGLILALLVFASAAVLFGYMITFLQAYAIYFLAGRYPLLDSILHPATPAPPPFFPAPPPNPIIA